MSLGSFFHALLEGSNTIYSVLIAFAHSPPKSPWFQVKPVLDDSDVFGSHPLQDFVVEII
jgi:hypothetical protein